MDSAASPYIIAFNYPASGLKYVFGTAWCALETKIINQYLAQSCAAGAADTAFESCVDKPAEVLPSDIISADDTRDSPNRSNRRGGGVRQPLPRANETHSSARSCRQSSPEFFPGPFKAAWPGSSRASTLRPKYSMQLPTSGQGTLLRRMVRLRSDLSVKGRSGDVSSPSPLRSPASF